jgi:hypothetical protein
MTGSKTSRSKKYARASRSGAPVRSWIDAGSDGRTNTDAHGRTDPDAVTHAGSDGGPDSDSPSDSDAHRHTDTGAHADADRRTNSDADGRTGAGAHAGANCGSDADSKPEPVADSKPKPEPVADSAADSDSDSEHCSSRAAVDADARAGRGEVTTPAVEASAVPDVFAVFVITQLPSTSTIGGPDRLTSLVPCCSCWLRSSSSGSAAGRRSPGSSRARPSAAEVSSSRR